MYIQHIYLYIHLTVYLLEERTNIESSLIRHPDPPISRKLYLLRVITTSSQWVAQEWISDARIGWFILLHFLNLGYSFIYEEFEWDDPYLIVLRVFLPFLPSARRLLKRVGSHKQGENFLYSIYKRILPLASLRWSIFSTLGRVWGESGE